MRVHVDRGAEAGLGHVPRPERGRRQQRLEALARYGEDGARGGGCGVRGVRGAHRCALAPHKEEEHRLAGCLPLASQLVKGVTTLGDPASEEGGERGRQRLRRRACGSE